MSALGVCLAAYVSGLISAVYFSWPPWTFLLLLLAVSLLRSRSELFRLVFLAVLCLAVGAVRYPLNLQPPKPLAGYFNRVEGQTLRIHAEVLATHPRPNGGASLDLEIRRVDGDATGVALGARVRIYLKHLDREPLAGQQVLFRSRIRRTRNFGTPGEFDSVRHLAYRRIWYTAFLEDDRALAVLAATDIGPGQLTDRVRREGFALLARLPESDGALLKALLLGEKGGMPTEMRQRLASSGIAHLFAISGLHLGLLSVLLFGALKRIYRQFPRLLLWQPAERSLWLAILPGLYFYLSLTGDALATRRAFFVVLVFVVLGLLRRRIDPLQLLVSLAFLFLLFEPLALWQPSFLLSFSGAWGILWVCRDVFPRLHGLHRALRYPVQLFVASFAATLATLPFLADLFHLFSPAALLNNLFAVPVVSMLALPMGLAGLLVSLMSIAGGLWLLEGAATILKMVLGLADAVTGLPGLGARSLYLTQLESLALLLCCSALLLSVRKRRALILLVPAFLLGFSHMPSPTSAELTLFSVGQGEAMLLRVAGRTLLIDGGGLRSETFDVGERLLAPALGYLGVKRLDAMVLTHNHPDHSDGLGYIAEHFPVEQFWSLPATDLPVSLERSLAQRDVPRYALTNQDWEQPGIAKEIGLWVRTGFAEVQSENDASLCLYLPTSAGDLLLTGDLEAAGVRDLIRKMPGGPIGLLKVPHHGSAGSLPEHYLGSFRPQVAAVSAGYANSYHFPSRLFLDTAAELGVEVWRTDTMGTIQFRDADGSWTGRRWHAGLFR